MNYKQIYFITLTSLFLFLNSFDFTLAEAANQRFGVRTDPQGRSLIFDKSNYQNINLWGVNYYPMGSLTQWLMKKSGLTNMEQWKTEIQKDLQDLAFIHVNFIRIHVFDREISNACGDLVDNEHLDLLEYLIDQAGQKGMTVQLTPIGWWWSPYTQSSSLSHIWHKKAFILGGMFNPKSKGLKKTNDCGENTSLWDRQNRYTSQLLSKINRYNKISMGHQPSIAMIEIMNEPEFWNYDEVKKAADAAWAPSSLPEDVQKIPWYLNDLKLVWADYQDILAYNHWADNAWAWGEMLFWRTYDYINYMTQTVRLQSHSDMLVGFSLFGKNSWGDSHSGESQIRTRYLDAVSQSTVDFVTEAFYPALGAACNPVWKCDADNFNLLSSPIDQQINSWKSTLKFNYNDLMKSKGRIIYEWGVAGNNNKAYAMVPMAREMRQAGVQAAAFFQYDTRSSAQLNGIYSDYEAPRQPEVYNIHFLNLYHSPSQAIDFFAARKAFWNIPLWGQYKAPLDDQWAWATFSSYKNNFSVASDPWSYAQSRTTTSYNPVEWFYLQDVGDIVTCVGSCRYWNYEGTGVVRFEVINDREATLTVCPDVTRMRTTLYADSANPNQPITQLSSGTVRTLKFINGLAGGKQVEFTIPATCSVVSTVSW